MVEASSLSDEFMGSDYDTNLGRLEVNLRSLEINIRIFLLINERNLTEAGKFLISTRKLKVNKEVEENWFTKYSHFSDLVKEYNRVLSLSHNYCGCKINDKLISLRNALAHGRAFYSEISPPFKTMRLLQFVYSGKNIKPRKIVVEYQNKMTYYWLDQKIRWVKKEGEKVLKACQIIGNLKP